MADERTKRFELRLTGEEAEMLREVAKHDGVSMADVVRLYVRRRYAEMKREAANG